MTNHLRNSVLLNTYDKKKIRGFGPLANYATFDIIIKKINDFNVNLSNF
jgi:hypothetical protein